MKTILPLLGILLSAQISVSSQAIHPYNNCPDVNIAIVRAGLNADTLNPYYLYNVNQSTGGMTLVPGGPYRDPVRTNKNLQLNGFGVSRKDGYIYGLVFDGTTTTARFFRADGTYGVTDLGSIPSPYSGSGLLGFVNPAAGDMDTSGNFYFSAVTVNPLPTASFDKFYIGKIANTQSLVGGGAPVVQYYEVDVSGANCGNYVSTFLSDPVNSGLKDFSYNAKTNTFFTYATYRLPGHSSFSAQLMELVPITGSSPLRYRLVCNPMVNTHNAETAGTLIDKTGKFTVLFTDGSFGMLDTNASGVYTGGFTLITASTGLPNPLRADMGSCGLAAALPIPPPPPPQSVCPLNIGVVRAGTNSTPNPYYMYMVDGNTGAFNLIPGGPVNYPGTTQPVQLNGIGVNKIDGKVYGMAFEGSVNTARLVKVDLAYNVTLMGNIPPPVSSTGALSFVNSAAGDVDSLGNYYFSAVTANPGTVPGSLVLDKLWLGKIPDVQTVTGTPTPVYYEIDWTHALCNDFISTFTTDPINSGVKDLFLHPATGTFYTYGTFKMPGDAQFRGIVLELRPIGNPASPSKYRLFCSNVVNRHNAETSGAMLSTHGKFMVLMTDGTVGYLQQTGTAWNYSGNYLPLNNSPGLPSPLRGDLGSCTNIHSRAQGGSPVQRSLQFSIHPNPANRSQDITLNWQSNTADRATIMIFDNYGVLIRTISRQQLMQGEQVRINAGDLAAGAYYIRVQTADGSSQQLKFVKIN